MLPPRWAYAEVLVRPLWDTLNIATIGTALGRLHRQVAQRGDRGDRPQTHRGDPLHRRGSWRDDHVQHRPAGAAGVRAGITAFRWDINIREATFLGLVGAGGIWLQLNASINSLRGADARMILVAIFALVLVSEWVSARVRAAIT